MANKYLRKYLTPTAATETTVYTVPAANTAVLSSLRVTNRNASTTALTANVYPGGGATAYCLLKGYSLPTNQTLDVFSGVPCVLEAGDVIKVTSSLATADFYLSYLEIDRA
jgi:putative hemolysin